jgi:ATP-dependent Clp protease ATP-binding subunit ClpA
VFERFTERARQVVVFAQDESRQFGHDYVGTEHILLGLLREEQGVAAHALESLGVELERVRADIDRIVGKCDDIARGQIPFTPRLQKVFERSLREALSLGNDYIGTEHLLLGLVRERGGVASRILLEFGAAPEKIRNEITRVLNAPGDVPPQALERDDPYASTGDDRPRPQLPLDRALLENLRQAKEHAITLSDFMLAASLRNLERLLIERLRGHDVGELPAVTSELAESERRVRGRFASGVALGLGVGITLGYLFWEVIF